VWCGFRGLCGTLGRYARCKEIEFTDLRLTVILDLEIVALFHDHHRRGGGGG
jgi:hypothetical protein